MIHSARIVIAAGDMKSAATTAIAIDAVVAIVTVVAVTATVMAIAGTKISTTITTTNSAAGKMSNWGLLPKVAAG